MLSSLSVHACVFLIFDFSDKRVDPKTQNSPGFLRIEASLRYPISEALQLVTKRESEQAVKNGEIPSLSADAKSFITASPLPTESKAIEAGKNMLQNIALGSVPPKFDVEIDPQYPFQLLVKGIRGTVTATFKVGSGGRIEEFEILDSYPPGLFENSVYQAAIAAKVHENSNSQGSRFVIKIIFDPTGTGARSEIGQIKP